MVGGHAQKVDIRRAREGIETLRRRILMLDAYQGKLLTRGKKIFLEELNETNEITKEMKHEIESIFGEIFSPNKDKILKSVELIDKIPSLPSSNHRLKYIEDRITQAKDILEEGVEILENKIKKIENPQEVSKTVLPPQGTVTKDKPTEKVPEKYEQMFTFKPTFYGLTIDVMAVYRRARKFFK